LFTALHETKPGFYQLQRLCAEDSFIPLGAAAYTVLPSVAKIIALALQLADAPAVYTKAGSSNVVESKADATEHTSASTRLSKELP
jgi:hypothetical protein